VGDGIQSLRPCQSDDAGPAGTFETDLVAAAEIHGRKSSAPPEWTVLWPACGRVKLEPFLAEAASLRLDMVIPDLEGAATQAGPLRNALHRSWQARPGGKSGRHVRRRPAGTTAGVVSQEVDADGKSKAESYVYMNKFTRAKAVGQRSVNEITGSRRLRRMRKADWSRRLVQESHLRVDDLIWPIFIIDGANRREPIASMPGVFRLSVDIAASEAERAAGLGIPAIATFPNVEPSLRDQTGSAILDPDNLINRASRAIKAAVPAIGIITDAALDPFTSHGHDGILRDGIIVNDETVEQVAAAAVLQAAAGADIIAPSDMMDGRVGAIRDALDENGFSDVAIMSYATKFASAFYGPYREAIGTAGLLRGDKKTYYLDPGNTDEALREAEQDLLEGADMIMVKPGMPYLDIIRRLKDEFAMPTFAYQVSGEYAMIRAAAGNGWIEGEKAMLESLVAFKRAGCDGILTYFAPEVAELLKS
jgi:porphobilinogen synthase